MYNNFDVETICLYRFGNTDAKNMNAVRMFLSQHMVMLWDVAGNISGGIISSVK